MLTAGVQSVPDSVYDMPQISGLNEFVQLLGSLQNWDSVRRRLLEYTEIFFHQISKLYYTEYLNHIG